MRSKKIKLAGFEGCWKVRREITDDLSGKSGSFEGFARFVRHPKDGFTLLYEEQGELAMEGEQPLRAERRYVWRAGDKVGQIDVLYDDGRPFHTIDLSCNLPCASHFCAPDAYNVSYDFRAWPAWSCEWRVQGPKKSYRLWSRYQYVGQVAVTSSACALDEAGAETTRT